MTVTNTSSKITYSGNGATTEFPIPFRFLDPSHIRVVLTSDEIDADTTNFTVSGSTLTYPASGPLLASGQKLTIMRWMDIEQGTQLENQGAYHPAVVEAALDERAMVDQQLQEQLDRLIKLPPSCAGGDSGDSNLAREILGARDRAEAAAGQAERAAERAETTSESAAGQAEEAAEQARSYAEQLTGLCIAVDSVPAGEVVSGSYNAETGMLTLRIPDGDGGAGGQPPISDSIDSPDSGVYASSKAVYEAARVVSAPAPHTHDAASDLTGILSIANGGSGNATGLAVAATRLETARTIRTDLGTSAGAFFDGTASIMGGVSGILPLVNGGTGASTAAEARAHLGIAAVIVETWTDGSGWYRISSDGWVEQGGRITRTGSYMIINLYVPYATNSYSIAYSGGWSSTDKSNIMIATSTTTFTFSRNDDRFPVGWIAAGYGELT